MMADSVAQEGIRIIAAVGDMGKAPFFQKAFHILPGHTQHRADDVPIHRGNAAKALQPGTPDQMHHHRFRIVIGGVGGGDFPGQRSEIAVPGIPGGSFQALLSGHDLTGANVQRNIVVVTQVSYKYLIPVRFFPPEMVVKMGRFQGYAQFVFQ